MSEEPQPVATATPPDILDVVERLLLSRVADARAERAKNPVGYDYAFALRVLLDMVMGDLEMEDLEAETSARMEAPRER